MCNKEIEIKITTGRELVEKERTRLLNSPNTPDFKSWLKDREYPLDWMKLQFGETLTELDGFKRNLEFKFKEHKCNMCGECPSDDEKYINMSFSFCDEYSCGMNLCKKCVKELNKMLK